MSINNIDMKTSIFNINRWASLAFMGLMVFATLLTSCDDEEVASGPITITKVFLEKASSDVPDREVSFARLGQVIRIEGSGFTGLKRVYINGYSTYFNTVYVSDKSMMVSVSGETPIVTASPDVRNTIRLANDKYEAVLDFEIRAAAPSITGISNTLPKAGESITIYGSGLVEVSKVVFPGNIEVTGGIESDVDGEFFSVIVPEGVSEDGGSLLIECSNGGAYSPAYFNFKKGVLLNFDGVGKHAYWGASASMIKPEDLESNFTGLVNASQGTYVPHRPTRIASFEASKNRCSEVWTEGDAEFNWRTTFKNFIAPSTPLSEVAIQFDIFVPQPWSGSGFLKICLINAFNGGEWSGGCYNYVPWLEDGAIVPFSTSGWKTVTIPLNKFYRFSDKEYTFEDVLKFREDNTVKEEKYSNFGFYFENSDFTLKNITGKDSDSETSFTSSATSVDVYTDNWRIVSLETPTYSDFPVTAE
jgi:hypothetical protein